MRFFENFLNLIFPITCVGCKTHNTDICEECLRKVKILEKQECPNCRKISEFGKFCSFKCGSEIFKDGAFFDHLIVCTEYGDNGFVDELITRFKYNFSEGIKTVLGFFLSKEIESLFNFFEGNFKNASVVPVPLHRKRLKFRGFNQSEILANFIANSLTGRALNLQIENLLKREINTHPQAKLGREERLINLKNAFTFESKDKRENGDSDIKNIILIDDVCTTGTTLNECARILKNAGAGKICGLVVARGGGEELFF